MKQDVASLKTSSYKLAYDTAYLMAKYFGLYGSVYHGINNSTRPINGRDLPITDYYSVDFCGFDAVNFFGHDRFVKGCVKPTLSQFHHSFKCKEMVKIDDATLYDITLDGGTHIFPINGYILTHNCGGGDPLSHPDFLPFLQKCKTLQLIPSMTINQVHFMKNISYVDNLINNKLIYGLGISLTDPTDDFIHKISNYKNAVIHTIAGLVTEEQLRKLAHHNLKLLILGYKRFRRGETLYSNIGDQIDDNIAMLNDLLPTIIKEGWFNVVSFDNLAIKQLDPKRFLTDKQWKEFFMGEDGFATMYVDGVNKQFARSSTSTDRYPITDNIVDMFNVIRS